MSGGLALALMNTMWQGGPWWHGGKQGDNVPDQDKELTNQVTIFMILEASISSPREEGGGAGEWSPPPPQPSLITLAHCSRR